MANQLVMAEVKPRKEGWKFQNKGMRMLFEFCLYTGTKKTIHESGTRGLFLGKVMIIAWLGVGEVACSPATEFSSRAASPLSWAAAPGEVGTARPKKNKTKKEYEMLHKGENTICQFPFQMDWKLD